MFVVAGRLMARKRIGEREQGRPSSTVFIATGCAKDTDDGSSVAGTADD